MAAGVVVSVISLVLLIIYVIRKKKCQVGKNQPEGQALSNS